MSSAKRRRQRANREVAAREAERPLPELGDDDLAALLAPVTVRADCEHASTRETPGSIVLTRCAVDADIGGGCPVDCRKFEARRIGGIGMGLGAG